MFQLTNAAAAHVADARRAQGLPESVGLRVFGEPRSGGGLAVGLTFAEVPAEDDDVVERDGTRVFVAPEVVGPLSSAALDVAETSEGERLVLTEQEMGEGI